MPFETAAVRPDRESYGDTSPQLTFSTKRRAPHVLLRCSDSKVIAEPFRSFTKALGLNVNETARPYDNAAMTKNNRSGSFKTLTIHRDQRTSTTTSIA